MVLMIVAALLIIYVVVKPKSGPLSFISVKTPANFVILNFRARLS